MTALEDVVRLEDSDWYLDDPWPVLARLRAEAPVFWYEPLNLWLLTKYEDIRTVGREPDLFSVKDGVFLNDFRFGNVLAQFMPADAEVLPLVDPPRHDVLRREMQMPFSPRVVSQYEQQVRDAVREILDRIEPGEEVDFVEAMSVPLPLKVIALLLGFPIEDAVQFRTWSDDFMKLGSDLPMEQLGEVIAGLAPMMLYFEEHIARVQHDPGEDVLSALVAAEESGAISRSTVHSMLAAALVAGNETARNTISGSIVALAEHPDQYDALAADPALAKQATEEFLRWVTPVRGFGRTVRQETDILGPAMVPGQRVYNLYMSANRDESAFEAADQFDITRRRDNVHLAFGFGQHTCIGAFVARLQIRILFEELPKRFPKFELAGEPCRERDTLWNNGWTSIPVRFWSSEG